MVGNRGTAWASWLLLAIGTALPAWAQPELREQVDQQVRPYLQNDLLRGLSVGILQNGQSHVWGWGSTGLESAELPDGQTLYEIGSITKVFTGLLLADAVERGQVRLDQPMVELFPADAPPPHASLASISLLNLSSHSSGLPRLPDNLDLSELVNPYAGYSRQLLYDFLHDYQLQRQPGEQYEYSNLAVGLLGQLLADYSGSSYGQLLNERILQPLQMSATAVDLAPAQQAQLAVGHDGSGQSVRNWDFQALAGAGAIRSTVEDMLRFAAANLDPPESELGSAIELAWRQHQPPLTSGPFAMGLGWLIARDGATRFHNGQTAGYHASLFLNRQLQQAVVVLSNTATMEVDRLAEDLFKIVAGMEIEPRQFAKAVVVRPEIMNRYVGKYQLLPGLVFTVSVEDDKLMVGLTGQPTFQVFATSETEWFYKVAEATITFKADDAGNWNELVLFQNGVRQRARRID